TRSCYGRYPHIVLTSMTVGDRKTKALKAGVAKYLIKTISPPEFTEVVRTLIQPSSFFLKRGKRVLSLANQERLNEVASNSHSLPHDLPRVFVISQPDKLCCQTILPITPMPLNALTLSPATWPPSLISDKSPLWSWP